MRISDWSSDVCSSDLVDYQARIDQPAVVDARLVVDVAGPVEDDAAVALVQAHAHRHRDRLGRAQRGSGNGEQQQRKENARHHRRFALTAWFKVAARPIGSAPCRESGGETMFVTAGGGSFKKKYDK